MAWQVHISDYGLSVRGLSDDRRVDSANEQIIHDSGSCESHTE